MLDDSDEFGPYFTVVAVHNYQTPEEAEGAIPWYKGRYGGEWKVVPGIKSWSIERQEVRDAHQASDV